MDLLAERGRRVSVDELNTTRLLAHARKQAVQRKLDDMLDRRRRCPPLRERELPRDPPLYGERRAAPDHHGGPRQQGRPRHHRAEPCRLLPGHGRPRHPLSAARIGEDRARQAARRAARRALDGRHERRLFLPVPDRHAQCRPASAEGDGGRPVLGLQPLAHREGAAGIQRPLLLDAVPAVLRSGRDAAPCRGLRRPPRRRRLHGDDRAQPAGQRQRLYEGLPRHGGARPRALVPFRPELERAGVQGLQPLPLGACARLHLLQHPALHQLGHQRDVRALPQAAGDLDRIRAWPGCRS